jgi:hypothetical protein
MEFTKVKLVVTVPLSHADAVRLAMGDAGAGVLGNYSHCSFSIDGKGRFLPMNGANPYVGKVGVSEVVEEVRIEVDCPKGKIEDVLRAMKSVHPYEQVAYDVYPLLDY